MPVRTIRVRRISQWPVAGDQIKFWIYTTDDTRPLQTLDAWKASLCDRARLAGVPVTVTTRETRYGFELVTAELQEHV